MDQTTFVHYLPVVTTLASFAFASVVFRRYRQRGGMHLLWWSFGILVYGLGTLAESWITLFGWSVGIFKFWYIVGALLGGAPLAQGTVWLLLKRRTARITTVALIATVTVAAAFVLASPIDHAAVDPRLPGGEALGWQWVRAFSPFINTYAVIFLVGGAIVSSRRFYGAWKRRGGGEDVARDRFVGNVLIASGAILPGLGGAASRMGHTEWLYTGELVGILLIWPGYWLNVRKRPLARRRPIAVIAMLTMVATLPAAPSLATQGRAELVVTVVAPDGSPAAAVEVNVAASGESDAASARVARTDARGRAVFAGLEGRWVISIASARFRTVERQVTVAPGQRRTIEIRLQLSPLAERVTVTATRTPRAASESPGEVALVGRSELEHAQARSLDDVFRYEPGVEMAEAPRRLGQTPNIRGFDDQRVLTLRDGARVAQFNSGHRGTYFFDVEDIQSIEVIKGPASALYGSGAIGGVVSITTRDPGDLLGPDHSFGASLRSAYSSAYGEWMVTPRVYGRTRGGLGWLASYTGRRNDGTVRLAGEPSELTQAEEDVDSFGGRITIPLARRDLLRVAVDAFSHSGGTATNLSLLDVRPEESVDRSTTSFTGTVRASHEGTRWFDSAVDATLYVDRSDIEELRPLDGRVDEISYTTWGFDVRNSARIGRRQRVTYGVEVVGERQRASRDGDINAFFPSGRRLQTGVFIQDEISLADGRLSVIPGLRWDRWNSRPENVELEAQTHERISPKLGATFRITPGVHASASYGEGFRAPFFQELFLTDIHFAFPLPGNRFFLALFRPNPELRPEKSRSGDFGLRFRSRALVVRGSYWRTDVADFIELLPVRTSPFPQPGGLQTQDWQAINRLDARLEGAEASANWAPHADWHLRGSYTRTRGEDRASGEPLLQIPPDKLVLGAEWARADLGTRVSWTTRAYGDHDQVPTGIAPTEGYVLHDLALSWVPSFHERLTLHIAVNNLTDAVYDNVRFGTPGIGRDVRIGFTLAH